VKKLRALRGGFVNLKELPAGPPGTEREEMRACSPRDYAPVDDVVASADRLEMLPRLTVPVATTPYLIASWVSRW
jgi:hypothetical protein